MENKNPIMDSTDNRISEGLDLAKNALLKLIDPTNGRICLEAINLLVKIAEIEKKDVYDQEVKEAKYRLKQLEEAFKCL